MSATQQARSTASRAANSKPLEYLARGGFIVYGVIHLLFAWLALQIALGDSKGESDQSGWGSATTLAAGTCAVPSAAKMRRTCAR